MRNCRTSKSDGEIEIYRTGDPEFDPEPTTLCYVNTQFYWFIGVGIP